MAAVLTVQSCTIPKSINYNAASWQLMVVSIASIM